MKGAKTLGVRLGNWLTAEEARPLCQSPVSGTLKGKRGRAIVAVLSGCGLRRHELADLDFTCAMDWVDNWIRFNSFSVAFPCRQQNAISVASSGFAGL